MGARGNQGPALAAGLGERLERLDGGRQRLLAYSDVNIHDNTIGHYQRHPVLVGPQNQRRDPGIRFYPSVGITLGQHVLIPVAEMGDPPMDYNLTNVQIFGDAPRYEIWQVTHLYGRTEMEIQRVMRVLPRVNYGDDFQRVYSITNGETRRATLPNTGVVSPTAEFMELLQGMAREEQLFDGTMTPRGNQRERIGELVGAGIGESGGRGVGGLGALRASGVEAREMGGGGELGDRDPRRGQTRERERMDHLEAMMDDTHKILRQFMTTSTTTVQNQGVGGNREKDDTDYPITTLDKAVWRCRTKGQGGGRIQLLEGLIRGMGRVRAELLIRDLIFDPDEYLRILERSMGDIETDLRIPGLDSLDKLPTVYPLSIFRNASELGAFVSMNQWPSNDYGYMSLRKFQYEQDSRPKWEQDAEQIGKHAMWQNIMKLEACLEVVFHKAFRDTLKPLECITAMRNSEFADGFLRYHIELMLANFFSDMYKRTTPSYFPDEDMGTPEGSAKLLNKMAVYLAESTEANPKDGVRALERPPHIRFFHPQTGKWSFVRNKNTTVNLGKPTIGQSSKTTCEWRACELMGLMTRVDGTGGINPKIIACKHTNTICKDVHPADGTTATQLAKLMNPDHWAIWNGWASLKEELAGVLGLTGPEWV